MSSPARGHPCLAFYRGDTRLALTVPAECAGEGEGKEEGAATPRTVTMGIILLHHTLFPPATVGQLGEVADENYAAQLASPCGLEHVRLNWRLLLCLSFPCLLEGDPREMEKEEDQRDSETPAATAEAGGNIVKADGTTSSPSANPPTCITAASVDACVATHYTVDDYNGLREPGIMDRIYYSFVVFLRFFGWKVHDEQRGVLDRHRNWEERYRLLEEAYRSAPPSPSSLLADISALWGEDRKAEETARMVQGKTLAALLAMPHTLPPLPLGGFDYYTIALLRITQSFLDFGFLTLAVGLVEFLLDEMASGRLLFLHALVEKAALPYLQACKDISESHTRRLGKKLYRLTHSDSD